MASAPGKKDSCLVALIVGFGGLAFIGWAASEIARWVA
jgi:hypothetical protein